MDVGSHVGQTIAEVVRGYPFDVIHAIEPMPREAGVLRDRFSHDPRVVVHQVALSHTSGQTSMFGTNDLLEASLYPSKDDVDDTVRTVVLAVRASEFFAGLGDELVVNMNCEGAEIPILEDLLDSGEIARIAHLLVDFDARKVVGMEQEPRKVVARLEASQVDFRGTYPDVPTHAEQIASWLRPICL